MPTDPIAMLERDHREFESLFEQYRSSGGRDVVDRICTRLAAHATIEEEVVYPVLGTHVPDGAELQGQAESEHQQLKDTIAELEALGYEDPGVDPLIQTIMKAVTAHVEVEESEVFPRLRSALSEDQLAEMGEQLASAREREMVDLDPAYDHVDEGLYEVPDT